MRSRLYFLISLFLTLAVPGQASLAWGETRALPTPRAELEDAQVKVLWRQGNQDRTLKSWYLEELLRWRLISKTEREPKSGQMAEWEGVDLENLVDIGAKGLATEEKANIDLLILKAADGSETLIPRSFVKKYSVVLAFLKDGKLGEPPAPFSSVPALSSYSPNAQEAYPVQRFFVTAVKEIVLTNTHERFAPVFLTRRTNPAALRGEKVFLKTCMNCHSQGAIPKPNELAKRTLAGGELYSPKHQKLPGMPLLSERQERGLKAFFRAHQNEKSSLVVVH